MTVTFLFVLGPLALFVVLPIGLPLDLITFVKNGERPIAPKLAWDFATSGFELWRTVALR